MSDIFKEVDEDLNRDRMAEVWKAYGSWIIGAALAVVIGVAGTQAWTYFQEKQQRKLSDAFLAANQLYETGKNDEAIIAYGDIASQTTSGYKTLSLMQKASLLTKEGKVQEAVDLYDELAARGTGDPILRDLAKLRAAWALADTASYDDLQARVAVLASSDSAFALSAQEVLAYSALRNGDIDAARIAYGGLANGIATPQGIRQRASALLSIIGPVTPTDTETDAEESTAEEETPIEAPTEEAVESDSPVESE